MSDQGRLEHLSENCAYLDHDRCPPEWELICKCTCHPVRVPARGTAEWMLDQARESDALDVLVDDLQSKLMETKIALREVLDDMGALGGSWWNLEGFTEERAKEIIALAERSRA